jgi:hypothetical protein
VSRKLFPALGSEIPAMRCLGEGGGGAVAAAADGTARPVRVAKRGLYSIIKLSVLRNWRARLV